MAKTPQHYVFFISLFFVLLQHNYMHAMLIDKIDTTQEEHLCPVCNKSFTRRSSLNQHKKIHTGERPYSCTPCDKKFTRQGDLKKHNLTHTKQKQYPCTHCKRSFTADQNRIAHERSIHTGERPYKCEYCNKGFTIQDRLTKHEKLHINTCLICDKNFTLKKLLTMHIQQKHTQTIYQPIEPLFESHYHDINNKLLLDWTDNL